MPRALDTIAALATPVGTAALAVVRVSGVDTRRIVEGICGRVPDPRRAVHADYCGRDGALIDDVVLTFYAAPRSYTGEDALEISSHGNPFIAQKILEDLWSRGCRPAEPGEFSQRAFLNGRMDLSQAEAVMDIIHARSERALAAANAQLRGALGRRMETLIDELLHVLARIEVFIDFPDEDLPREDRADVSGRIRRITRSTNELRATSRYGALLRDGVKTVLVGAPNAGKSSLLNALVAKERALVSPEPGTTRDFIEERVMIGAHCVRLIDTAGMNASPAPLERLGIEKTIELLDEADLFLAIVDAAADGRQLSAPDWLRRLPPSSTVVVHNKIDLLPGGAPSPFGRLAEFLPGVQELSVSAFTGHGLAELRAVIGARADALGVNADLGVAINARHADALRRALDGLGAAAAKLDASGPMELVASDLRDALAAFGEITGRVDNERMLDALFATFCIGK